MCYQGKKQCAYCQSFEVRIKSSFIRQVRHQGIGDKSSLLKFQAQKLPPKFLSMVKLLKDSPFQTMNTLGKIFYSWCEEITRMWRFSKSNCFRNFGNYRRRVRILCS